jgi:hypothetical protein
MIRHPLASLYLRIGLVAAWGLGFAESACATTWLFELVDGPGDQGSFSSVAIDPQGNPGISYCFADASGGPNLMYAARTGLGWVVETVDSLGSVGIYTSLAFDSQGNPRISYYDETNGNLKFAAKNGGVWTLETVDAAGDVGLDTSLELDAQGNPRISYLAAIISSTNGDLKYAAKNGGIWSVETVDSLGWAGEYTSLDLDSQGNPHISYFDRGNDDVKYAVKNGPNWSIEIADPSGGMFSTSIAVDASNRPHISYHVGSADDLRYAFKSGGVWIRETVDTLPAVSASIVLDPQGAPHIGYTIWFPYNDLKYAVKSGVTWTLADVDTARATNSATLALDAQETPHFAYYQFSNNNLRYATVASATDVPQPSIASAIQMGLPWPNPAPTGGALSIRVDLPHSEELTLEMLDITGRRVAARPAQLHEAGSQIITWQPPETAPGVYVVHLRTRSGLDVTRSWTRMR